MLDEQDDILNVPHSLPSNSHMVAIATRTPSGSSKVRSNKYMPDYGGILEIPGTKTKQCGLRLGIPFDTNPYYVRIEPDSNKSIFPEPKGCDCLITSSYLDSEERDDIGDIASFSTVRAVGKTLYLDLVRSIPSEPSVPEIHQSTSYGHVPYSYQIAGLKYCDSIDKYVIVKFAQGVKLIKLNRHYKVNSPTDPNQTLNNSDSETEVDESDQIQSLANQSAINDISSFAEKQGVVIKDASLSRSQNWLYIASSDCQDFYVKLYDLSTSKQCYNLLTKSRDNDAKIKLEESQNLNADRKRSLRSFIPAVPLFEELQQIACDPNHLVNSLVVTSNRVALVDPRENSIIFNYADKFKMVSIAPSERFKKVKFSHFNEQQLYLMSDMKLRALDRRYPSKDLNVLDHMIDSIDYDVMTMEIAPSGTSDQETLCLSAYGHICLCSFDQSHYTHSLLTFPGNLVNPRSMHNPIHEPSPTAISGKPSDELYGLAVHTDGIFSGRNMIFSTLQLSQEGDVCVRGFPSPRDNFLDFESSTSSRQMVRFGRKTAQVSATNSFNVALLTNNALHPQQSMNVVDQLNVLDPNCILEAEKLLTTKRAAAKYDWMKKKLRRK